MRTKVKSPPRANPKPSAISRPGRARDLSAPSGFRPEGIASSARGAARTGSPIDGPLHRAAPATASVIVSCPW
ncbi:hypothetical protein [Streptomyces subrutilus]|uniref:hypothetical protein n=1 Tax=Streptomyces subrutilus TaxID=36818 RepID=UPI00114D21FD|nr:hypothetical protein [Streptomyces subrutilus]